MGVTGLRLSPKFYHFFGGFPKWFFFLKRSNNVWKKLNGRGDLPPPYFRTPPLILLTKENSNRKNQSIAALGGVGFVKQRGGEEEPKEVWGAGPAKMVVEVTGA